MSTTSAPHAQFAGRRDWPAFSAATGSFASPRSAVPQAVSPYRPGMCSCHSRAERAHRVDTDHQHAPFRLVENCIADGALTRARSARWWAGWWYARPAQLPLPADRLRPAQVAVAYTLAHDRVVRPGLAQLADRHLPSDLRRDYDQFALRSCLAA